MYKRKTRDVWHINTNYGYGWETENVEYTKRDALRSYKEYKENLQGRALVRLEKHRERL